MERAAGVLVTPSTALTTTPTCREVRVMATGQPTVEYRGIKDFPGYRVGSDGSVWSRWQVVPRHPRRGFMTVLTEAWHQLTPAPARNGYMRVTLSREGRGQSSPTVHRLVLVAFVGPPPDGMEACHNDGDRSNNALSNLRWDTRKANLNDRAGHGTLCTGSRNGRAKVTAETVLRVRAEYAAGGVTQRQLAARYGLSVPAVSDITRRKNWRHI